MVYTIQVESIEAPGKVYSDGSVDEDGAVYYLLLAPCLDKPCTHVCEAHPGMEHRYERQAFTLGQNRYRKGATQEDIANDRANVWGWNGNLAAPTLSPSFLAVEVDKQGRTIRPYRAHFFLNNGRIDLCGDSTVVVHANPVRCRLRE